MNIIGEEYRLPVWTEVSVLRREAGGAGTSDLDPVIVEHRLALFVEGKRIAVLTCSPMDLAQLAAGHLLAQGWVRAGSDIASVAISPDCARADVALAPGAALRDPGALQEAPAPAPLPGKAPDFDAILAQAAALYDGAELFRRTGAAHSSSLALSGAVRFSFTDVSRHNTVDKVVGQALIDGIDLRQATLFTSGRIPLDMMEKVVRCGIPVVCSRSAPTSAALELARRANVALVGFVRDGRMNVYHQPDWIREV